MASTYIAQAHQIPLTANKHCLDVFNPTGSGKILKVYRIWMENNQNVVVTGVVSLTEVWRTTSASGGLFVVPVTFDSANVALGTVNAGTGRTIGEGVRLRRWIWSSDEAATQNTTNDEFQLMSNFVTYWDSACNDANIQPIVVRENQGVSIKNVTSTVGHADFFIEFTVE